MELNYYLKENYSPTAIKGYTYMIRTYRALTHNAHQGTYQDVISYIAHLRETGKHPKTIRNHLFAIKIYYNYLLASGKREDHPCRFLCLKDKINRSIDVQSLYTIKQMQRFFESYTPGRKNRPYKKREQSIISLLIHQGLAVLEISQLNLHDIDLNKATISIKANVKNNSRTLDLKPGQIMLLHTYIATTRKALLEKNGSGSGALFISNVCTRVLPHGISRTINAQRKHEETMQPKKIRQSVIAHLLKTGNNLRVVQVFAGHKRADSTEKYKQNRLEELKATITKLHPLG